MIVKFKKPFLLEDGRQICALEGYQNGCFTLLFEKDGAYSASFYSQRGKLKETIDQIQNRSVVCGAFMDNDTFHIVSSKDMNCNIVLRLLQTLKADWSALDALQVFNNNWYYQRIKGVKTLLDENGCVKDKCIDGVKIFNLGYAVTYQEEEMLPYEWQVKLFDGTLVAKHNNVTLLGDGCFLKEKKLYDFSGELLLEGPFIGGENFLDGKFVLTDEEDSMWLHDPQGEQISVSISNAEFMPDGCFIQYDRKLTAGSCRPNGFIHFIQGLYRPNGFIEQNRPVWTFEKAGLYYLLNYEYNEGQLYDYKGKYWGNKMTMLDTKENFSLFRMSNELLIFNQNGEVQRFVLA